MDKALLTRLQRLSSRREYSSYDMRIKAMRALDGKADEADEIVSALVSDGFVDDARYAAAFARDRAFLGGWGPMKIRMALAAKKIPPSLISEAVESIDRERADARLDRLAMAKYKTLKTDPQLRMKLVRYLLGRGYDYDAVMNSVSRCLSD